MRGAACQDIHLAVPRAQNGDRQMRRRAETEKPNSVARLNPSNPQAAKADDAGAQERRCVKIIQLRRKSVNEIAARRGILRIAAVHGVSGEDGRITKIFESATAIWAGSVYTADPGNTDARTERQLGGSTVDNIPHNLVPGYKRLFSRRQLAFYDVEIGTADSAGANPKKDLPRCGLRRASLFNVKRLFRGS